MTTSLVMWNKVRAKDCRCMNKQCQNYGKKVEFALAENRPKQQSFRIFCTICKKGMGK